MLEPGDVRAEAEVGAEAERDVRVRVAVEVDLVRVGEHGLVPVGRRVDERDAVAFGDRRAGELGRRRWRSGTCCSAA